MTAANTLARHTAARRRRETAMAYLMIAPPTALIFGLFFYPATLSIIRTLSGVEGAAGQLSAERYLAFFHSPAALANLWFTFGITLSSIALLFVVCYPLAIYLRFSKSRVASWCMSIALMPLFVPGIMTSYALIRFLRPRGMLVTLLNLVGLASLYQTPYLKPAGIVIGLAWEGIPFTIMVLTAGLGQIDDSIIDSARDVGANNLRLFWHFLLPLSGRAALIAFCLNFIGNFGAYTIPYLLGPAAPQTMGVYMQQTLGSYQRPIDAETQAVITFAICLIVGALYIAVVARSSLGRGGDSG